MAAPCGAAGRRRAAVRGRAVALLPVCALLWQAPALADVDIRAVRAAEHPGHTRLVVDLSGPAEYRVSSAQDPRTLYLDIRDGRVAGPLGDRAFAGTPILSVAQKPHAQGVRLRIALRTALRAETFTLKPYRQRGDRIVLDLYPLPPTADRDPGATPETADSATAARPGTPAAPDGERVAAADPGGASSRLQFNGTWEQEWAVTAGDGSAQKFESVVQPELQIDLARDLRLTAIGRIRVDTVGDLGPRARKPFNYSGINGPWASNEFFGLDLREFYLDARSGDVLWRLGKQQVVWGEADGIKVMDVINPQSYREFILDDFDDSRIPLWTVNAEVLVGDAGSLQLLWIPDTTYHELAEDGTPFELTSPLLVPRAPAGLPVQSNSPERPDDALADSDAGMRFATFLGGWDLTLNYLYHYRDFPVPYQALRQTGNGPLGVLAPEYERSHLAGGTASNVFGPLTLRTELVYNSDTYHVATARAHRGVGESDEIASVLGLDWRWEAQETLISAQWFQSHLLDHVPAIVRSETEHTLSLLYQRDLDYDTWSFMAMGLYSVDRGDRWLQVKLNHVLASNLELWVGGDFFAGDSDGVFGQFGSRDRVLLGLEYGF